MIPSHSINPTLDGRGIGLYRSLLSHKILSNMVRIEKIHATEPDFYCYACFQNPDAPLKHSTAWNFSSLVSAAEDNQLANRALIKMVEKYSLFSLDSCNYIHKTVGELGGNRFSLKDTLRLIDPTLLQQDPNLINKPFGWVSAENITHRYNAQIPAQFLYPAYYGEITYETSLEEPYLLGQYQIINGSAASFNRDTSLRYALYEAVERDAFTNMYVMQLVPAAVVVPDRYRRLRQIIETMRTYSMEVQLFDLTLDIKPSTFLALIVDPRSGAIALSYGCSAGFTIEDAMIQAVEKAYAQRVGWQLTHNNMQSPVLFTLLPEEIHIGGSHLPKGAIIPKRVFSRLCHFFNKPLTAVHTGVDLVKDDKDAVEAIIKELKRSGYEAWAREVTDSLFEKYEISVYKVFIPGLQEVVYDNGRGVISSRLRKVQRFLHEK